MINQVFYLPSFLKILSHGTKAFFSYGITNNIVWLFMDNTLEYSILLVVKKTLKISKYYQIYFNSDKFKTIAQLTTPNSKS